MGLHRRLIESQDTSELLRKAIKSNRKGYGKRGSFFRATREIYDLDFRLMDLGNSGIEKYTIGRGLTTARE